MPAHLWQWSKLASPKWEEEWRETLLYLGVTRLAILSLPGGKRIRLQLYGLHRREANDVVKRFGGIVRHQANLKQILARSTRRPPIRIRDRLVIHHDTPPRVRNSTSRAIPLVIPAAAAFGTGEHRTTATCLRLLCDLAGEHEPLHWDLLDLGTGSGILALAAKMLGARAVEACDFDASAVRIAKENAGLNGIRGVKFQRRDVTDWKPARQWDVVTANLYSTVLITAAVTIGRCVRPGGRLILSGMLREQEDSCVSAFTAQGFVVERVVRTGKWVAVRATRTPSARKKQSSRAEEIPLPRRLRPA